MPHRSLTGPVGLAVLIVALLVLPSAASAANSCDVGTVDKTWVGNTDASWATAANWNPVNAPTATQDVCIPAVNPSANPVPVVDGGGLAASIESFKPIQVTAGTLRINSLTQASIFHNDLDLGSGTTLDNRGSTTVQGDLDWSSATITAASGGVGTVTVAAGGTTTATVVDSQRFLNHQILHIDGAGTFAGNDPDVNNDDTYLSSGATLEIGSGGSLDLQGDQDIHNNGGTGTNSVHVLSGGTLSRSTGTVPALITTQLDNDGTVSAAPASTPGNPALSLQGGSGTQTSSGQFSPAAGAVLDIGAGSTNKINGATFTGSGLTNVSSGTLSASGTNTVAAGGKLALNGSTLANTGTFTVNGTLDWGTATISGAGTTTIAAAGALTTTNGDCTQRLLDTQIVNVNGTGTFEGATGGCYFYTGLSNGATLNVGSGGNLDLQDDQQIFDNGGVGNLVHVLSGGTLKRTSAAGTDVALVSLALDNDGTVTSTAGTMRLSGGSGGTTSTGQYTPATGAVIDFAGGTHSLSGSSFGGAGTTRITAGEVDTAGSPSVGASSRLELSNSTLANTGTLTVNGTLDWGANSTISGAGTTTLASTGTLTTANGDCTQRFLDTQTMNLNGNATFEGATAGCYFQTGLANGAKLNVGSGGNLDLQDDQLIFDNGGVGSNLVHVLSGGTLKRTSAAGTDAAEIGAALTNDGTIDVQVGKLRSTATLTNYNQATDLLSGGIYTVKNGSILQFNGADVKTNGAEIILDGAGSGFQDESALNGLRNYNSNNSSGKLRLRNGRNFTRTGAFTNNGVIDLAPTTKFTATGNYTQTATGTYATDIAGTVAGTSYGQLVAGATATLAGTLDVDVSAYPPQTGDFFDVVLAGTRTGTFSAVTGTGFTVNYLADRVRITPPTLTITDRRVDEPDTGTTNASFEVDLSSPSPGTVTVDYATADGSGRTPSDYTATSGTLTFTPGQTQKFINVPVRGDLRDENLETYFVNLSSPQLADIADSQGVGRITDNDPPPAISITDSSKQEGGVEILTVSLSAVSSLPVTATYQTADDTATAPGDYPAKTGTVKINPGKTSKTIRLSTTQDTLNEADETFNVNLSGPGNATIADATGQATILDNDPVPSMSINDVSRNEGGVFQFTVTLSAASGQQVRVHYDTVDGSAIAPGDYTAASNNVTFTPGQLTRTISISSVNDLAVEGNEAFSVHLSAPIKATIADADGTGTIVDND